MKETIKSLNPRNISIFLPVLQGLHDYNKSCSACYPVEKTLLILSKKSVSIRVQNLFFLGGVRRRAVARRWLTVARQWLKLARKWLTVAHPGARKIREIWGHHGKPWGHFGVL